MNKSVDGRVPYAALLAGGDFRSLGERLCAGVMVLALAVYDAGWMRYFLRGRERSLLSESWLGIPVPLAISAVVYFGAASLWLHSAALAAAALLFGVSHVPLSYREYCCLGRTARAAH